MTRMRAPHPLITVALAIVATLGCKPTPSDSFVAQVKETESKVQPPTFHRSLGVALDGSPVDPDGNQKLRAFVEVMANSMGFKVEASQVKKGFMTFPRYEFVDFHAPTLPGVSFRREGQVVHIQPDFKVDMIIESILEPMQGFEEKQGKAMTSAGRQQEIATATALGVKDAAAAVDADIAANKEKRKERAKAFAEAVERVRKDNGFKRAWFVNYRLRKSTSIPKDSPFWTLVDAFMIAKGSATSDFDDVFWKQHGEVEVKDSLAPFCIVAFEGQDGKLAKSEGWKAFITE